MIPPAKNSMCLQLRFVFITASYHNLSYFNFYYLLFRESAGSMVCLVKLVWPAFHSAISIKGFSWYINEIHQTTWFFCIFILLLLFLNIVFYGNTDINS